MLKRIATSKAPKTVGPYSQAVQAGNFVFFSGQIGIDPESGQLAGPSFKAEAIQALDNLVAVIDAAGLSITSITRVEIMLTDMANFEVLNDLYEKVFTGPVLPARQTTQVSALPKNAQIELSCIGYKQ